MKAALQTHISDKLIAYDGSQLAPHWIYRQTGIMGDAIFCFVGPTDVTLDHMVDLEDVRNQAPIYSPQMLHFIGEWFQDSLENAILMQHIFMNQVYELLWESGITDLERRGNDIYYKKRKLSVSIATKSPVSTLMHAGINVETEGTPIPTSGLSEMGIKPFPFAREILKCFERDSEIWRKARVKVLPR